MRYYKEHLLKIGSSVKSALERLDVLALDAILFIVDGENRLVGSLTDGDIRRGLLRDITIDHPVDDILHKEPKAITKGENNIEKVISYRDSNLKIIPIVDSEKRVINVINFRELRSYLPVDAVIMAGGEGRRLRPLTEKIPKPLLKVGDKPILEHNLDRLRLYGIDDYWITIKYLGDQIESYFGNSNDRNINIEYVREEEPLGTIGAVSLIENFTHDHVLITNSDILTNLDYEHFFLEYIRQEADFSVVTIPYHVDIPYAVLEMNDGQVMSFSEKPTYTYFSNGGIYLMKSSIYNEIPRHTRYDATDLMSKLIDTGMKVISYPLSGYWLDVGNHSDFAKAQSDLEHIIF